MRTAAGEEHVDLRPPGGIQDGDVPLLQRPGHDQHTQGLDNGNGRHPLPAECEGDQVRRHGNEAKEHGKQDGGEHRESVQPHFGHALLVVTHSGEGRVDHPRDRRSEERHGDDHYRHREVPDPKLLKPEEGSDEQHGDQSLENDESRPSGIRNREPRQRAHGGSRELERWMPACRHDEAGRGHRGEDDLLKDESPRAGPKRGGGDSRRCRDERGDHARALDHAEAHRSRKQRVTCRSGGDQEQGEPARDHEAGHFRFTEQPSSRIGAKHHDSRSDHPGPKSTPVRSRGPALRRIRGLNQRRSVPQIAEDHRVHPDRDRQGRGAVVARSQQTGEGDDASETDGLDRDL